MTALIIPNKKTEDIMEIDKALEESVLLIKVNHRKYTTLGHMYFIWMSTNQQELMGQHCNVNDDNAYFDSFGIEYIPKEIKKFIINKNIKPNIYSIKTNDSIMCGYFYIKSINFYSKRKTNIDYSNLFSPSEHE